MLFTMFSWKLLYFAYLAFFLHLAHANGEAGTVPVQTCRPPLWHGMVEQNWPLGGVIKNSKPIYRLTVKGLSDGKYKAGKEYVVSLVVHAKYREKKSYNAFFLTLHNNDTNCVKGSFSYRQTGKKIVTPPTIETGCVDPLVVEGTTPMIRSHGIKWVAPTCGCVTIRATVKNADGILFYDTDSAEIDDKYEVLTTTNCKE